MTALLALHVADDPAIWTSVGFSVNDGTCRIGGVDLVLRSPEPDGQGGVVAWSLTDIDGEPIAATIEGLANAPHSAGSAASTAVAHPNGVVGIDHLVVSTPDLDRTIAAFEAIGMPCMRRRDASAYGRAARQAFFWLRTTGPDRVVLEVVGPAGDPTGDGPAQFFGLALTCADLLETVAMLGEIVKPPNEAVQAGRQITTISQSKTGLRTAIALMSAHVPTR